MNERAISVRVDGGVQGVGYRAFVKSEATRLGIRGWVCNRADGSVEGAFYAAGDKLATLVGSMRNGPAGSRVDNLDLKSSDRGAVDQAPHEAWTF